ncbi:MAG: ComF family protein [Firmicutes bacterium]|nr:ComF family protein [Bacillota bacterium]
MVESKKGRAFNQLASLIYPSGLVCLSCKSEIGTENLREESLCLKCLKSLPYIREERCTVCLDMRVISKKVCANCASRVPCFDKLYAPFYYSGAVKQMVLNYKDGETYLSDYIAKYLALHFNAQSVNADILAFVPASKKAVLARGFNHMELIAKALAPLINLPLIEPLIKINHAKAEQKRLSRLQRTENIKDSFLINPDSPKELIESKTVLLIDDVVTTTATINECSRVLLNNGASLVLVLAFARHASKIREI